MGTPCKFFCHLHTGQWEPTSQQGLESHFSMGLTSMFTSLLGEDTPVSIAKTEFFKGQDLWQQRSLQSLVHSPV
jgi:hypothetical protein